MFVEVTEAELGAMVRALTGYLGKVLYPRVDARMCRDPDGDFDQLEEEIELVAELADRLEETVNEA